MVEQLVQHGAQINVSRVNNLIYVHRPFYFVIRNPTSALQYISSELTTGSVEETPLAAACARGFKRIAEFLIQCGANVNYKCSVSIAIEMHVTSSFLCIHIFQ